MKNTMEDLIKKDMLEALELVQKLLNSGDLVMPKLTNFTDLVNLTNKVSIAIIIGRGEK